MKNRFGWHARFAITGLMCAICLSPPVHTNAASPSQVSLVVGEPYTIPVGLPQYSRVETDDDDVIDVVNLETQPDSNKTVFPKKAGNTRLHAKLFGFIPWKSVDVHVEPRHMVYVGGQSIGVSLHVKGTMVVGYQPGPRTNDLRLGDVICQLNNHPIESSDDLRRWLTSAKGCTELCVQRGPDKVKMKITLRQQGSYRPPLGVYVRDKTAGIGTLTFYDPTHHSYGALGHVITDPDSGQPIKGWGSVYESDVTGIVKSEPGRPGEKRGRFTAGMKRIGDIQLNTPYGLFGHMDALPRNLYNPRQVVVALPEQVHTGPAVLLTVLHDHKVEAFGIQIENTAKQNAPSTRSMVIHVTDPRLLKQTGGIVQGMSGSPILQDGKLVGAVTHVFMSDSTRGYGLYAEWMINAQSECTEYVSAPVSGTGDIIAV